MARISILGLGLIGGSLALALKESHQICGVDPCPQNRRLAEEAGIRARAPSREVVRRADCVVLAGPLAELPTMITAIASDISPTAVVTDVGSVKGAIVAAARRSLPDGVFVGGHPLAGSTGQGFSASHPGLFRGASWALITETPGERAAAFRVKGYLEMTGAVFYEMSAADHDQTVAFTSHLPYLASIALARTAQLAATEGLSQVLTLVGPGFRDATRLAMTPPGLGEAITFGNQEALLQSLEAFRNQIEQLEDLVRHRRVPEFSRVATQTGDWRHLL